MPLATASAMYATLRSAAPLSRLRFLASITRGSKDAAVSASLDDRVVVGYAEEAHGDVRDRRHLARELAQVLR